MILDAFQRKPSNQSPPEIEAEVVRLYLAGTDRETIRQKVGVGHTTISSILRRNGVELRGQPKTVVTPQAEAEVVRMYKGGASRKDIIACTGVPSSTISVVLKRNGVELKRNSPKMPPERVEAIKSLFLDGKSYSQISEALGVSTGTIAGVVHRNKIKRPAELTRANVLRARKQNGQRSGAANLAKRQIAGVKRERTASQPSNYKIGGKGHVYVMPPTVELPKFTGATPNSKPKPWTERLSGECTWPVSGEGMDTFSCCAPVTPGTCWCDAHNRTGRQNWSGQGYHAAPDHFTSEILRKCA